MQIISSQSAGRRIALVLASVAALCRPGAAAYRETAVAEGGRIVGTVRVAGEVTPLPPQPVFKEKEFCGESVPATLAFLLREGIHISTENWPTWILRCDSRLMPCNACYVRSLSAPNQGLQRVRKLAGDPRAKRSLFAFCPVSR